MELLAQNVGIDIYKANFVAYFDNYYSDLSHRRIGRCTFDNTPGGHKKFVTWSENKAQLSIPFQFIMEATGRLHESLAYHLYELKYRVCIVLPNRIKNFGRSLNEYSKTDPIDAKVIAYYGAAHQPRAWQPANKSMRELRELTRERQDLVKARTQTSNRMGALRGGAHPPKKTLDRLDKKLRFFARQIELVEADLERLRSKDEVLAQSIKCLTSIPYIGLITAYTFIAETNGVVLFENRNQLIKYAGMDVDERQSGTSIKGKSKISKRGNGHLRRTFYMSAVGVIRQENVFSDTYQRAYEGHKCKKMALVAVMRQLMHVAFGVHQSNTMYCEKMHRLRSQKEVGKSEDSPTVAHLAN